MYYKIKPDYSNYGLSIPTGPELRALVEQQLGKDLAHYVIIHDELRFDWSESCIEGHDTEHLGSSLENYSGIAVFDHQDKFLAEGWMEFIHEGDFFLAYWEFLTTVSGSFTVAQKTQVGIPQHVWQQIPEALKGFYGKERMQQ